MSLRWALVGDGESPHLLKWARALAPHVELWAASSRGFDPAFDRWVPPERQLRLGRAMRTEGGNVGLLRDVPTLARWLRQARADWVHAHYLSSHGTISWLAQRLWGAPGGLIGSAWGSDILVTPQRSAVMRWMTTRVLRDCALSTSDSQAMTQAMLALGAGEVMTFPFGLEQLPPPPGPKERSLFFSNRALEPLYRPHRVLEVFARIAADWPEARLVMAHDGSLRADLEARALALGLADRVHFTGRLAPDAQQRWYERAQWYFSLPASDSVSVSVLEAMAHGAVPLLSDLPANRELVRHLDNGWLLDDGDDGTRLVAALPDLRLRAEDIGFDNHAWVCEHAHFPEAVGRFLDRVLTLPRAYAR